MNTTAPRPTEDAAIGRCMAGPKPSRNIVDIAYLRSIAIRNKDRYGVQLFTAMLRRLAGVEVAW